MPMQEELESSGNWLFRWRSYLPLFLGLLFFASMRNYHYPYGSLMLDYAWEAICLLVCLGGLSIRAITIGHTAANTSGRNTKSQVAAKLNTTGIYSTVRHPLYLGNFFMMLGIALLSRNIWSILVFSLVYWLYYERIMFAEEAYLRRKFGEEYLVWGSKTPPFIPSFKNYQPADLPFSLKNVLRREYNGFFAFILAMFVLETYGEWVVNGQFTLRLPWIIIVGIGFVSWMILRTLKKKTKLLNVEGR